VNLHDIRQMLTLAVLLKLYAMTHTLYRNVNDYFRRQGVATAATRELFDLVCNAAATTAAVPGMLKALQDKHAATEEDASDKVTHHM
jgi:hypothetical protein